jgi:hypothetical protein
MFGTPAAWSSAAIFQSSQFSVIPVFSRASAGLRSRLAGIGGQKTKRKQSRLWKFSFFESQVLYHCPFEIRLCSVKGGHGRIGRVETGLLSRTMPIGTKGADRSTGETRCVPLLKSKSKRYFLKLNAYNLKTPPLPTDPRRRASSTISAFA